MITNRFSSNLKQCLYKAYNLAWTNGHKTIKPTHLLWALSSQKGSIAAEILNKSNISTDKLETAFFPSKKKAKTSTNKKISFISVPQPTLATKRILKKAVLLAYNKKHKYIGTEHLLEILIETSSKNLDSIFKTKKNLSKSIKQQLQTVFKSINKFPNITETFKNSASEEITDRFNEDFSEESEEDENTLEQPFNEFAIELTAEEIQTKIDPVIARDKEIERLTEILLRRTKNNPLLIGEPGVGKTAIVEGFAKDIFNGMVPPILQDKKIYNLDLGAVVSGTIYRGEFEERLKKIIEEAKNDENVILFIDEIHLLIGAGASSGSMDAANLLKPALARGQLRCIGATTFSEYKKHIEKDPALARRFQLIKIEEPKKEDVFEILNGLKENYEQHHRVKVTDQAINAAVSYSEKFLTQRFFPDKAIDLIDEASSKIQLRRKLNKQEENLKKLKAELESLKLLKEEFLQDERYEEAIELRDEQTKLQKKLNAAQKRFDQKNVVIKDKITEAEIAHVVANLSGVPVERVLEKDHEKALQLEQTLNSKIIGQNQAMTIISNTIKRNSVGLSANNKPMGSFIFAGPSGVGKTMAAKTLAETVFGNAQSLIRFDMSEYSEKFNISKLLGAPAGYVGHEDGGALTNRLQKAPYSVILFDEIEKAHPDVFHLLLQILDEGMLTDGQGNPLYFKNNVIILTTNIGAKYISGGVLGFGEDSNINNNERIQSAVLQDLKQHFPQELLNRVEEQVVFSPLSGESLKNIVEHKITELNERLKEKKLSVNLQENALDFVAKYNTKPEHGARNIEKNIKTHVENLLADIMLSQKIKKNDKIEMTLNNNKLEVV